FQFAADGIRHQHGDLNRLVTLRYADEVGAAPPRSRGREQLLVLQEPSSALPRRSACGYLWLSQRYPRQRIAERQSCLGTILPEQRIIHQRPESNARAPRRPPYA